MQLHASLERAIQGDTDSLAALRHHFPPPTPKVTSPKPVITFPSRPIRPPQITIRAPTIRYASFTIPIMIYPHDPKHRAQRHVFNAKLAALRALGGQYGFYQLMLYHLELEEKFLAMLEKRTLRNWGVGIEAGVRETKSIVYDIGRMIAETELNEGIAVEAQLKKWVMEHPGVKFKPYGERMTRKERREFREWQKDVNAVKRRARDDSKKEKFMSRWHKVHGKGLIWFHQPRARSIKRHAKGIRKKKLGKRLKL